MKQIEGITTDYKQNFEIAINNNESAIIDLYYLPSQLGWFIDITFGDFVSNGMRVVCSPNLLGQYDEILPFGFTVLDMAGNDPTQQNSWVETHSLYLIEGDELATAREI